MFQEEQNRGKPNWEHLNDELHVLITVEDTENRATLKLERAVDEVKKLLTVVSVLCNLWSRLSSDLWGFGGNLPLWDYMHMKLTPLPSFIMYTFAKFLLKEFV